MKQETAFVRRANETEALRYPEASGQPMIEYSVIVPVYQHWHLVPELLKCLGEQTLPPERFEVILVDNLSPDFAPPAELPSNTRLLRCDKPGSYAARNLGAQHARGAWLIFTDADCLPAPDWLEKHTAFAARQAPGTLVAGAVNIVSRSPKPSAWEIYDIVKGIPQEHYVRRGYAATANLAVPRTVFEMLGGFDGSRFSGGDADLCRRAGHAGHDIAFAKEARVDHPSRTTWEEIATKARRIKGGQLASGSVGRRRIWLIGTINPPVAGAWRFLKSTSHPLPHRLVAVLVLFRIWIVGLQEAVRLKAGGVAERR